MSIQLSTNSTFSLNLVNQPSIRFFGKPTILLLSDRLRPNSVIRLFSAFRLISVIRHISASQPISTSRLFDRLPRKEGRLYITNSPFTPVGGESTKPILFRHATSFSIDRIFVSMSDPFSSVGIFARTNSFSSTLSLNQWYLL